MKEIHHATTHGTFEMFVSCGAKTGDDPNSATSVDIEDVTCRKCLDLYNEQHSNCDHCGTQMSMTNKCLIGGDKVFCKTACLEAYRNAPKCECGEVAGTLHVCYTQMYSDPKFREMVESMVDERIKEANEN